MKRVEDGVEIESFRARKPRPKKEPTISIEEMEAQLKAKGLHDFKIEVRQRVGRSEAITLRFPDRSRITFTHNSARDPDGSRKGLLEFIGGAAEKLEKIAEAKAAKANKP